MLCGLSESKGAPGQARLRDKAEGRGENSYLESLQPIDKSRIERIKPSKTKLFYLR
jgi:hypothetical protein